MGVRGREAGRKDEEVQGSFAKGIDEELDILASYFAKTPAEDQDDMPASARERAVHLLSELVGAIILARAVAQANLSLSDEILEPVFPGLQNHMNRNTTFKHTNATQPRESATSQAR